MSPCYSVSVQQNAGSIEKLFAHIFYFMLLWTRWKSSCSNCRWSTEGRLQVLEILVLIFILIIQFETYRKTGTGTIFKSFQGIPFAAPPVGPLRLLILLHNWTVNYYECNCPDLVLLNQWQPGLRREMPLAGRISSVPSMATCMKEK